MEAEGKRGVPSLAAEAMSEIKHNCSAVVRLRNGSFLRQKAKNRINKAEQQGGVREWARQALLSGNLAYNSAGE